jgi:hypothetical protein
VIRRERPPTSVDVGRAGADGSRGAAQALLRSATLRQVEATISARYQIASASSSNATASRWFVSSSTASS